MPIAGLAMTTSGGRRDQRWIGAAILVLAAALLAYGLWIGPATYSCPSGTPCPAPGYAAYAYLSLPILWVGLFFLVIGLLPPTETFNRVVTD